MQEHRQKMSVNDHLCQRISLPESQKHSSLKNLQSDKIGLGDALTHAVECKNHDIARTLLEYAATNGLLRGKSIPIKSKSPNIARGLVSIKNKIPRLNGKEMLNNPTSPGGCSRPLLKPCLASLEQCLSVA